MKQQGLNHPGRWVWVLLLVPVALGFLRLRFDADILSLLPGDLPAVEGLRIHQEHFANARELILTLRAPDGLRAEAVSQAIALRLRSATNLVKTAVWQAPWMENPAQASELVAYYWMNQPTSALAELEARLAPDKLAATLEATREQLATSMSPGDIARLSYDPFGFTSLPANGDAAPAFAQGANIFSSEDGRFRVQFVKANEELNTYRECDAWLGAIKEIVQAAVASTGDAQGVQINYTGRPAFVVEIARGMQKDMKLSVAGTAVVIGILFWIAHRRWKPMLWLITLLALILASTLGLGGLIFGSINVVSMGFAAILLGLAVDYGVVHYQEALAHPQLSVPQIRRAIAPSIFWAATTTIAAFLALNWGGLPGLAQLGSLVALGVFLAACVMVYEFLPVLFPDRDKPNFTPPIETSSITLAASEPPHLFIPAAILSGALLTFAVTVLAFGFPTIDPTANALRPRHSPAYSALAEVQAHLGQDREPLWLIFGGATEAEVAEKLRASEAALALAKTNGLIISFTLPLQLWPQADVQGANRPYMRRLVEERAALRQSALANGFSPVALGLMDSVLDTWEISLKDPGIFWPTNAMSEWVLQNFVARSPTHFFALGLLEPKRPTAGEDHLALASLATATLPQPGVWLSGWELLGRSIFERVRQNFLPVLIPMVLLSLLSLGLAFRRLPEVLLSVAVLALSGLCLLAVMRLVGWSWNLLNLMAIPLILGTGIDYSIFMQLALKRFGGDRAMAYRSVGRALLLCGSTAIAGFGTLGLSSNAGMASLGQVCAIGIAANMIFSVFLLPAWWTKFATPTARPGAEPLSGNSPTAVPGAPSSFYRSEFWVLGVRLVKALPIGLCRGLTRFLVAIYWLAAKHRREVVIQNLLPVFGGDISASRHAARNLFRNFAIKLIDLWRYEGGMSVQHLLGADEGWENMIKATDHKRGVLLLSPHVGNWEFGGPWLTQLGLDFHVITLEEPGEGLTNFRREARARWQVKTVVIGNDPFGFVQIIRLLESGATIALLMDRPSPASSTLVQLFGQPFPASVAAAELARASGCALLPGYVIREGSSYTAHLLPQIPYDRPTLRDRAARQALTQKIMTAFEPVIRKHADQWYHFVSVWAKAGSDTANQRTEAGQTLPK